MSFNKFLNSNSSDDVKSIIFNVRIIVDANRILVVSSAIISAKVL